MSHLGTSIPFSAARADARVALEAIRCFTIDYNSHSIFFIYCSCILVVQLIAILWNRKIVHCFLTWGPPPPTLLHTCHARRRRSASSTKRVGETRVRQRACHFWQAVRAGVPRCGTLLHIYSTATYIFPINHTYVGKFTCCAHPIRQLHVRAVT
jgi:hypothetical protein